MLFWFCVVCLLCFGSPTYSPSSFPLPLPSLLNVLTLVISSLLSLHTCSTLHPLNLFKLGCEVVSFSMAFHTPSLWLVLPFTPVSPILPTYVFLPLGLHLTPSASSIISYFHSLNLPRKGPFPEESNSFSQCYFTRGKLVPCGVGDGFQQFLSHCELSQGCFITRRATKDADCHPVVHKGLCKTKCQ